MINDSNRLRSFEINTSLCGVEKLTHAEYDTLRDLAARYLSYQALFQCLVDKLPDKPGVKEAWERLGDCIMCSDEEAEKRRIFQNELESKMRKIKFEHSRSKREQDEERKQTIASALNQQRNMQKVIDHLQESMNDLVDQLRDLQ